MFKLLLLCYLALSLVVMPEHKAQALKLREFGECSDTALRRMGCTIRCIDDDGVDMHVLEPGVALAAVRKCVEVDCVDRWSQECDKKYKYAFAKNVSFRIAGSMGLGVLDALGLEPAWEKVKDMNPKELADYLAAKLNRPIFTDEGKREECRKKGNDALAKFQRETMCNLVSQGEGRMEGCKAAFWKSQDSMCVLRFSYHLDIAPTCEKIRKIGESKCPRNVPPQSSQEKSTPLIRPGSAIDKLTQLMF